MKKETRERIRKLGIVLFTMYIFLLVYFLFFAEGYGRAPEVEGGYRYNLVPFTEIKRFWTYRERVGFLAFFSNIFGNIIGFIPFGFILPMISNKTRSGVFIVAAGFVLSLGVETIQLITRVGCFDVDDLILNTLGALIGYLLLELSNKIRRWLHGKKI